VVLNKAENTASLLDLASGSVAASLPTGIGPHEVAVSPDGQRALATNYGSREVQGSSLTLIDIPAARVAATIDLGAFRRPHGVRWLDDTRAVVTAEANRTLLVVDVERRRVRSEIRTDQDTSHMVAVTPDGQRAFVANIGSGSVTAIDLEAGQVLAQIQTGEGAEGIDIGPDGREVWVANRAADSLSVIDAQSLAVVASIPCGEFPIRVRITPDGRHALVSNARSADLAVFDVAGRSEVARIRFGEAAGATEGRLFGDRFGSSSVPIGVVVSPDGARAWVAHANADRISVVDLGSWQAAGHLTAGREPDGMAYSVTVVQR
jgi:YVTN family beta-propeller protein